MKVRNTTKILAEVTKLDWVTGESMFDLLLNLDNGIDNDRTMADIYHILRITFRDSGIPDSVYMPYLQTVAVRYL